MKKLKWVLLGITVCAGILVAARVRFQQYELHKGKENVVLSDLQKNVKEEVKGTKENSEENVENPEKKIKHISQEITENLKIDADIIEGTGEYYEYGVSLDEVAGETVQKELSEMTDEEPKETDEDEDYFACATSNGGWAAWVQGTFQISKKEGRDDDLHDLLENWINQHEEDMKEEDLPFMSEEEASELVMTYIKKFTQEECKVIWVKGLDADHLKKSYQEMYASGDKWSIDENELETMDGAYLIKVEGYKDGLPVYSKVDEQPIETVMEWSVAQKFVATAVVTKDGIRFFQIDNPYKIDENKKRKIEILTASEAADIALKRLLNQILNGTNVIDKIYLEYIMIADTEMWKPQYLRPYWTIEYVNTTNENGVIAETREAIRINAETGEDAAYGK